MRASSLRADFPTMGRSNFCFWKNSGEVAGVVWSNPGARCASDASCMINGRRKRAWPKCFRMAVVLSRSTQICLWRRMALSHCRHTCVADRIERTGSATKPSLPMSRERSPRRPPGLHFTPEMLASLPHAFVTLHVGEGTFQPVKTENIADHQMHSERFSFRRRQQMKSIARCESLPSGRPPCGCWKQRAA